MVDEEKSQRFERYAGEILDKYVIRTYLEIGCGTSDAGMFIRTRERLMISCPSLSMFVYVDDTDLKKSCPLLADYINKSLSCMFLRLDASVSNSLFNDWICDKHFNAVIIHTDKGYDDVKHKYENVMDYTVIIVFKNLGNVGIKKFWNELKKKETARFLFEEFLDRNTQDGIGVIIKI